MAGSPTIGLLFAQRVVIAVGDLAVSNNTQVVLSTYALGSCIGLVAYDPAARAGGILHLMLPDSSIAPHKAATQPAMFADTGLPAFFRALNGLRADRNRTRLFMAGGASVVGGTDPFKIGERNTAATLEWLANQRMSVRRQEVGGAHNRTVHLEVSTGKLTMKTPLGTSEFSLGD